jgi:hypothetical protein
MCTIVEQLTKRTTRRTQLIRHIEGLAFEKCMFQTYLTMDERSYEKLLC